MNSFAFVMSRHVLRRVKSAFCFSPAFAVAKTMGIPNFFLRSSSFSNKCKPPRFTISRHSGKPADARPSGRFAFCNTTQPCQLYWAPLLPRHEVKRLCNICCSEKAPPRLLTRINSQKLFICFDCLENAARGHSPFFQSGATTSRGNEATPLPPGLFWRRAR